MAQFDFPVGAVAQNTDNIIAMIAEARDEYGAELVVFPELAISGYPPEDLLLRPGFLYDCEQALKRIAEAFALLLGRTPASSPSHQATAEPPTITLRARLGDAHDQH
jgi:predicted amidohydrolase